MCLHDIGRDTFKVLSGHFQLKLFPVSNITIQFQRICPKSSETNGIVKFKIEINCWIYQIFYEEPFNINTQLRSKSKSNTKLTSSRFCDLYSVFKTVYFSTWIKISFCCNNIYRNSSHQQYKNKKLLIH